MENGKSKAESVRDKWDTGDLTYEIGIPEG